MPPIFRVDPGLIIWLWVTFGILFLILRKTAWPAIIKGLDARAERVKNDLEKAKALREEAEEKKREYEKKLLEAKDEARRILEAARRDAVALTDEMQTNTRKELEDEKKRARIEIAKAQEEARNAVQHEIVYLATEMAERILQREVSEKDQTRLVETFFKELEEMKQ